MRLIFKMKVVCIISIIILVGYVNSWAQNLIAVQNANVNMFYTTLDSAIIQAHDGDTIFIPGGNFPLQVPINKRIYIMGVGHNPDSTSATNFTFITNSVYIFSEANNGLISGVYLLNDISFGNGNGNDSVKNYTISRCNFNNLLNTASKCSRILINENVIRGNVNLYNITNHAVYNNIINGVCNTNYAALSNNIFFNVISCQNCSVENNIFTSNPSIHGFGCSPNCCNCSNSIFLNNLFVEDIPGAYGNLQGVCTTLMGNNNIYNQNIGSIFLSQNGNIFNYNNNYHIQISSLGHSAGTDGLDVGIYGGPSPWKEGSVPFNPHIQFKNISANTNQSGNLPVNIKVAAQNH